MMLFAWFFPKKQKDDPSVKEITKRIDRENVRLDAALVLLDEEVSSMQVQRVKMNKVFDDMLNAVAKRKPK